MDDRSNAAVLYHVSAIFSKAPQDYTIPILRSVQVERVVISEKN